MNVEAEMGEADEWRPWHSADQSTVSRLPTIPHTAAARTQQNAGRTLFLETHVIGFPVLYLFPLHNIITYGN
jgi:hypothetical protein